jgi:transposase
MQEKGMPKRQYTEEFIVEALKLSESVGFTKTCQRLGLSPSTLAAWKKKSKQPESKDQNQSLAKALPTRRPVTELEAENSRLRRELASAKLDVEILRKATAYFAKGSR